MGRRGPAPAPTQLRLLRGDRPGRINRDEPRPRQLPPAPPEWLSALAAEEWQRIAPDLDIMGSVAAVDATAVAAYCEAVAVLRQACQLVAASAVLISNREGALVRNPAVAIARDASANVRSWARELGLTPAARAGIRVDVHHHGAAAERLLS